jgi:hypothetical protein
MIIDKVGIPVRRVVRYCHLYFFISLMLSVHVAVTRLEYCAFIRTFLCNLSNFSRKKSKYSTRL